MVYEHFGAAATFPGIEELMDAVDKGDAAQFSLEEILEPSGWTLLNFLMDPRTGLGRFREFRISNYQLMMELIDACTTMSVEEILAAAGRRRARRALLRARRPRPPSRSAAAPPCTATSWCSTSATRRSSTPRTASRSTRCSRQCNVSIHVLWGLKQQNTVFATGKSIIDRGSRTNVGELMLSYGGGGHEAAGTCQIANEDAPRVLGELVTRINADG